MIDRITEWFEDLLSDVPAMEELLWLLSRAGGVLVVGGVIAGSTSQIMMAAGRLAPSAAALPAWLPEAGGAAFGLGLTALVGAFMLRTHIRTVKNAMR